jgi:hypothetical protein
MSLRRCAVGDATGSLSPAILALIQDAISHNQKITMAASATAEKKTASHGRVGGDVAPIPQTAAHNADATVAPVATLVVSDGFVPQFQPEVMVRCPWLAERP